MWNNDTNKRELLNIIDKRGSLLVDYHGFPPSHRGTLVHRLIRKGFLSKRREKYSGKHTSRSFVFLTDTGKKYARGRYGVATDPYKIGV